MVARVPTLTDGVVTLRAHREDDIPAVLQQCQDAEMQRWTSVPVPYTLDDAKTFVRHIVPGGWESGRAWEFAVTARDEDGAERFVGGMALTPRGDGLAEIGYGTHPWARRRGLTERAARLVLAWGFAQQDVTSVEWVGARGNWASRRLAWRLGFGVGAERHWMHQRGTLVPAWRGTLTAAEEQAPRHPWFETPVLHGEGVLLRPPSEPDLPRVVEVQQDHGFLHFLEGPRSRAPHTLERDAAFVEERREWAARGEAVVWTVADPQDDRHLGLVQLFHVQHRRQAELGFWAHPDARGRGLTGESVRLALRHAFVPWDDGGLGLRRVHAAAAEGNAASRGLLRAVGMRESGRDRLSVLLSDGSWCDDVRYDVLADEREVVRRWTATDAPSTSRPSEESATPTHAADW